MSFTGYAADLNSPKANNIVQQVSSSEMYKGAQIKPGVLVVKVKSEYKNSCSVNGVNDARFVSALYKIQSSNIEKKFPLSLALTSPLNRHGKKAVDLGMMYKLNFVVSIPIEKAINTLMATGMLEYAEPLYIHNFDFTPNDPSLSSQYFIGKINAYNAWDIH